MAADLRGIIPPMTTPCAPNGELDGRAVGVPARSLLQAGGRGEHARPSRLRRGRAARLGARAAGIWDRAQMHAPIGNVEAGRAEARRLAADCCVAIGGGTPIGLAKAIALELAVPIVAVPTTYAGSEMTPVLGITDGGVMLGAGHPDPGSDTIIPRDGHPHHTPTVGPLPHLASDRRDPALSTSASTPAPAAV